MSSLIILLLNMLSAPNRLTKDRDFKKIRALGKAVFSPYFRLKYLANGQEQSCFAAVVSTKISKKAVIRNRLKRQIREIIRLNLAKIKPGYNVVISPQPKALGQDFQGLKGELAFLFDKARLLK
ncbi:MAG: ribonuclease P protein component [Candidatus Buchananbacteria bacterium]